MSDPSSNPASSSSIDETTSWTRVWLPRVAVVALITFAVGAAITWGFIRLTSLFTMLLLSLFLAFAMEPAVERLARRGWRRGAATGLVIAIFVLVVIVFIASFITLLVDQASILANKVPSWVDSATVWLNDNLSITFDPADVTSESGEISQSLLDLAGNAASAILGAGASLLGTVFSSLTMGLFVFYLLADAPKVKSALARPFRPEAGQKVIAIWDLASQQTGNYVYSRAILAGASAVFHFFAFWLIGLPSPLGLALFVGIVSQFVPNVGTYIAGALPTLVALASATPSDAIWVLVAVIAYQQFENIVLANKITAETMSLHPAVAFGAVIAGANLLGAVGALLALPVAATVQSLFTTWIEERDKALADIGVPGSDVVA